VFCSKRCTSSFILEIEKKDKKKKVKKGTSTQKVTEKVTSLESDSQHDNSEISNEQPEKNQLTQEVPTADKKKPTDNKDEQQINGDLHAPYGLVPFNQIQVPTVNTHQVAPIVRTETVNKTQQKQKEENDEYPVTAIIKFPIVVRGVSFKNVGKGFIIRKHPHKGDTVIVRTKSKKEIEKAANCLKRIVFGTMYSPVTPITLVVLRSAFDLGMDYQLELCKIDNEVVLTLKSSHGASHIVKPSVPNNIPFNAVTATPIENAFRESITLKLVAEAQKAYRSPGTSFDLSILLGKNTIIPYEESTSAVDINACHENLMSAKTLKLFDVDSFTNTNQILTDLYGKPTIIQSVEVQYRDMLYADILFHVRSHEEGSYTIYTTETVCIVETHDIPQDVKNKVVPTKCSFAKMTKIMPVEHSSLMSHLDSAIVERNEHGKVLTYGDNVTNGRFTRHKTTFETTCRYHSPERNAIVDFVTSEVDGRTMATIVISSPLVTKILENEMDTDMVCNLSEAIHNLYHEYDRCINVPFMA
jgi:hypothetical protein